MATLRTERLSDADVAAWGERLADGIARGMQLDSRMLDVVICTLLAGGHLLLEDRPGVGKTQLARSLAASIDGGFARVPGTVDLLPTDVLGTTIWRASTETFEFHPGPIFANVVLVDELNRATPKTQSGVVGGVGGTRGRGGGKTPRPRPPPPSPPPSCPASRSATPRPPPRPTSCTPPRRRRCRRSPTSPKPP